MCLVKAANGLSGVERNRLLYIQHINKLRRHTSSYISVNMITPFCFTLHSMHNINSFTVDHIVYDRQCNIFPCVKITLNIFYHYCNTNVESKKSPIVSPLYIHLQLLVMCILTAFASWLYSLLKYVLQVSHTNAYTYLPAIWVYLKQHACIPMFIIIYSCVRMYLFPHRLND